MQKDAQSYQESVQSEQRGRIKRETYAHARFIADMLLSGAAFGSAFASIYGADTTTSGTVQSLPIYDGMMEELRETLIPEIELIENRIIGPIKDFNAVIKSIRKNITKRDHKASAFSARAPEGKREYLLTTMFTS